MRGEGGERETTEKCSSIWLPLAQVGPSMAMARFASRSTLELGLAQGWRPAWGRLLGTGDSGTRPGMGCQGRGGQGAREGHGHAWGEGSCGRRPSERIRWMKAKIKRKGKKEGEKKKGENMGYYRHITILRIRRSCFAKWFTKTVSAPLVKLLFRAKGKKN